MDATPLLDDAVPAHALGISHVRELLDKSSSDASIGSHKAAGVRDSDSDVSTTACGSVFPAGREELDEVLGNDEAAPDCGDPCGESHSSLENVCLLSCFLELCHLYPVDEGTASLLLHTIGLLRRCGYSAEEMCAVLAHASVYFEEAAAACPGRFRRVQGEAGYILTLLTFLAHCHVLDETCPLRLWHRNLFEGYCTLGLLDKVLMRLLAQRNYRLRVSDDELAARFGRLLACFGRTCGPMSLPDTSPTTPALDMAWYAHAPL